MKFSKWILGTALLFSAQMATVQGQNSCDPCDPCYENPCDICDLDFCDVKFDFYVDALYWKVCHSDLHRGGGDGDVKFLNPEYHWGYRVGGHARWKCLDLGLRYTSLDTETCHKGRRVSDGEGEGQGSGYGRRKDKFKFDFDVLDIELGYACCLPCGLNLRPFVGAKLAWIDDRFVGRERDFDKAKIDHEGYGLYLGAAVRWDLTKFCYCEKEIPIAIVARGSTGLLHGDFKHKVSDGQDIRCHCNYIPVHELYVALDFRFCDLCGCGEAFFQVGYEAQYWGWQQYADRDDLAHLGLGGLVLRFGFGF